MLKMPSDAIDIESAAKLDAAYAIAALSSGPWPTSLILAPAKHPDRPISYEQASSEDYQNVVKGHHVSSPVMPTRSSNNSQKPQKRNRSKKEILNARCEAAAENESHLVMKLIEQDENRGQFVRSASACHNIELSEVRTENEGLCSENTNFYTQPIFLQNTATSSGEMERTSGNTLDLNSIQHDVILQIQRMLASGMSFQIVPLPNVLTPGVTNNGSTNTQLVTSPQFLQIVQTPMSWYNGLGVTNDIQNMNVEPMTCLVNGDLLKHVVNDGSASHIVTESSINIDMQKFPEVGKFEPDKMINAEIHCHSQLPGSLSTLRNYYKSPTPSSSASVSSAGISPLHLVPSEITSAITVSSLPVSISPLLLSTINVSPVTDSQVKSLLYVPSSSPPGSFDRVSVMTASKTDESSRLTTTGAIQLLDTGYDDCPVDMTTEEINLNNVSVPGSLSILRQFYNSYDQDAKSRCTENVNHSVKHVVEVAAQSSVSVCRDQPVKRSSYLDDETKTHRQDASHRHGNGKNRIASSLLSHRRRSKKKGKQIEKHVSNASIELDENGSKNFTVLLKSFSLGKDMSASSLPAAPVHVQPQIHNSRNQNLPTMQQSTNKKESHAVICLPPKKWKLMSSVFGQKESCAVLQGGQMLPLNNFKEFLNRLLQYDRNAYQQFMDQIKSANVGNPLLESVPLLLDEISNQSNQTNAKPLQSSSGLNPVNRVQSSFSQTNLLESVNCQTKPVQSGYDFTNYSQSNTVQFGSNDRTDPVQSGYHSNDPSSHGSNQFTDPSATPDGDSVQSHLVKGFSNETTGINSLPCFFSTSSASSLNQRLHHPVLQEDEDGDLPLHVAVAKGSLDVIDRLLQLMNQLNASVNCRNNLRQTPLHLAVIIGDCEIVRHLLVAGACPNMSDRNGQNSLHLAVQYNRIECLRCIYSDTTVPVSPDLMNYEGMTALHLAAKHNLPEVVIVLLQNGANCDIVDGKSGHTALYMAADSNRLQIAEILLTSGANIQITSYSGCSPVQAASSKSFADMVKLFVKYGASEQAEKKSDANFEIEKTVSIKGKKSVVNKR